MTDLLEHQMPPGMAIEGGRPPDEVEIAPMPVNIAGDQHLVGILRRNHDDAAAPAGRLPIRTGGPVEGSDHIGDVLR